MKIRYLILVGFVLAILTMGAVSASQDCDNMTQTDNAVDVVSDIEEVDVGVDESDDVIGGTADPRYNIVYPKEMRMGPDTVDESGQRLTSVKVSFYDEDITGNVECYVDNEYVGTSEAVYDWSGEDGVKFTLSNLGLASGLHNVTIKYSGDDRFAPFEENMTFELYYMKVVAHEVVCDNPVSPDNFYMEFALDASGYADLYLDGNKVATYDIAENLEYRDDCRIYVDFEDFTSDFGMHTYMVKYHDGEYADKTVSGSFILSYYFYVDYDQYPLYGEITDFNILLPKDATGNVNMTVNGRPYTFKSAGGEFRYAFGDFDYGENNLTFTYEDSKFPKQEFNLTLIVLSTIEVPDSEQIFYNSVNDNFTLALPADARGNLTIYERKYNDEIGDFEYVVLKTAKLVDGRASISLSDLPLNTYYLNIAYDGDDYYVEDIQDVSFSIVPAITYESGIWTNSTGPHSIVIELPGNTTQNLKVEIWTASGGYYEDLDFESELVETLYDGPDNGNLNLELPSLDCGFYSIHLIYGDCASYYKFSVRDVNPNLDMDIVVPSEIAYRDDTYFEFSFMPKNFDNAFDGRFALFIDGECVKSSNFEPYVYWEFYYDLHQLSIGNHTWKVTYEGDSYYMNASKEGTIEVVWTTIQPEVYASYPYISVLLHDGETGYVSLLVDGKDYAVEFINGDYAFFDLGDLAIGEHTYELIYSGDAKHQRLTKTGSFNFVMDMEVMGITDGENYPLAEAYEVVAQLPDDATGTVTFTVSGKSYTVNVVDGTAALNITGLDQGNYTLLVKYSGDSKYPTQEYSANFSIEGFAIHMEYDELGEFKSVSLRLPSDADGNLSIGTYHFDYDTWEYVFENIYKTVKLVNGTVKIMIEDLVFPHYGSFDVIFAYQSETDDYQVNTETYSFYGAPGVSISAPYLGEDALIEIDLKNQTGNVTIFINGEEFKTVETTTGKIVDYLPADKLVKYQNLITFQSDNDVVDEYFRHYDDGTGEFQYEEFYCYPSINLSLALEGNEANITVILPEGAAGNITVDIDDKGVIYETAVQGGKVTIPLTGLAVGEHHLVIRYIVGSEFLEESLDISVEKPDPKVDINIPEAGSSTNEFTIELPSDATGTLIVNIGGKNYVADLVNGKATITVPELPEGDYNVTVKYSGDGKYAPFSKTESVENSVPPRIVANDLTMMYSDGSKYSVTVYGTDGKVASGVLVTFKIGTKVIGTAKTNENGIASIKITQLPKTYKITVQALDKSVTKKLTVKQILSLKKVTVKRSAKKLVISATLKKVKGKYLKGKKITFKFNGKKYTAKTNKKGVAKVTIKKSVLKKLKKGKKVTYQATYLKDTVKRTVKVKK